MLIVRGTASFRDRVPGPPAAEEAGSTTALGGWYANLLRWRTPVAVLVNERTLLTVLVPVAPARTLLARLPAAVADVLRALELPEDFIAAEVAEMQEVRLAPTADRRMVGLLTEVVKLLNRTTDRDEPDRVERSLWLAELPMGAPDYVFPGVEVHRVAQGIGHATGAGALSLRALRPRRSPPPPAAARARAGAGPVFPTSITGADGQRIEIRHQPGMGQDLLEELKPLLIADGIDLDDPDDPPELADLQAAMARAVERRDLGLFTPVGRRRDAALAFLSQFSATIAQGADAPAAALLARVEPEAHAPDVPEVSAVIGVALDLLDAWLTGRAPDAPADLAAGAVVPRTWRREAKQASQVLALATRGRAFSSRDALITRQGGEQILIGAAVAVAAAAQAWARRTGEPLETLLPSIVR